ncbi:hypothetical protein LGQ03_06105 [Loktanella sp. TSTF-M6]|uniref:Uncharacterized protein n=1 Tax=Loktanella gaetbuli TaxID=2881335 RepID=A0ABS8BSU6_9RHOB|nr:hypothetical protein [Loktanella gaetbuli]MCB5198808.1 hypothetical protein [Loktanella gaetbuli]
MLRLDQPRYLRAVKEAPSHVSAPLELAQFLNDGKVFRGGQVTAGTPFTHISGVTKDVALHLDEVGHE